MLLYHALSAIVYELPVMGIVVYIGKEEMNMPVRIVSDNLRYNYRLINLRELNPEMFLQSDIPEEIIMAILAGKSAQEEKREIIRKILYTLRQVLRHDSQELERRIAQLEVIGELRDVQKIILEEEKFMAITYNLEKDIRYNQGLEKGLEKGLAKGREIVAETNTAFVIYLLQNTPHSDKEIANLVNVPLIFVRNIKKTLRKE